MRNLIPKAFILKLFLLIICLNNIAISFTACWKGFFNRVSLFGTLSPSQPILIFCLRFNRLPTMQNPKEPKKCAVFLMS
jgi:hypothetical protein